MSTFCRTHGAYIIDCPKCACAEGAATERARILQLLDRLDTKAERALDSVMRNGVSHVGMILRERAIYAELRIEIEGGAEAVK